MQNKQQNKTTLD